MGITIASESKRTQNYSRRMVDVLPEYFIRMRSVARGQRAKTIELNFFQPRPQSVSCISASCTFLMKTASGKQLIADSIRGFPTTVYFK